MSNFKKYPRRYRRKPVAKSTRKPRRKATSRVTMTKIAERVYARKTENKSISFGSLTYSIPGVADQAAFDVGIIPLGFQTGGFQLNQGSAQGERIGNQITIKKCTFRGCLYANAYDATLNPTPKPTQVKMILFYDKENPNDLPEPAQNNDYFDTGNGVLPFQNNLFDHWGTVNDDRYKVLYTRTFKIGRMTSSQNASGTSTGPLNLWNSDFKLNANFSVDYTKYMIKAQKFRDASIDSVSRQLYCMFLPAAADGSGIFSGVIQVKSFWEANCIYEDA